MIINPKTSAWCRFGQNIFCFSHACLYNSWWRSGDGLTLCEQLS
jgi:hypothetical protein